jgi:hypothetical protein
LRAGARGSTSSNLSHRLSRLMEGVGAKGFTSSNRSHRLSRQSVRVARLSRNRPRLSDRHPARQVTGSPKSENPAFVPMRTRTGYKRPGTSPTRGAVGAQRRRGIEGRVFGHAREDDHRVDEDAP